MGYSCRRNISREMQVEGDSDQARRLPPFPSVAEEGLACILQRGTD